MLSCSIPGGPNHPWPQPMPPKAPDPMRLLFLLLTAMCLSLLSFGAAADARAALPGPQQAGVDLIDMAAAQPVDDLGRIVVPGDDGLHDDDICDDPPPGYCNIWSADLLDPLDLLDEIEESSALFALPPVKFLLPSGDVAQHPPGRAEPPPSAFFRPPIALA
ncbi:putative auxiliary protein (cusF homolog) of the copper-transporting efflux system CusCFBA [Cupriavidus taiwanensis]|nr:putative auxiliary protein (cusF homolog) of the copper-transporting efflux system CusCFBA [Cupriavidus taiwanensis]SOZ30597.1 putative auxiliary protein (cusF homolog) of the copper-transporting efflux system CusCFBA [Cupriavidus taiwanensis]SOZ49869.1 putative auxiliary protein (cusF homolog) of the copper-transporting efflux system CusCFBA [Cupriavidus taiwanensis]SPA01920.1 putative auxiliary protein (cusF homolog) of the copper-transporting efflux system CusCFBA [Cupriavidus taiwanensis]